MTADEARAIWNYDPETGHFFWRVSPRYRVVIGDRAGAFNGKYWILQWRGKSYKASRVAWLVSTGEWPKDQIDHINLDKLDDRFGNLREASNAENCRNRTRPNRLGMKGVTSKGGQYQATICVDGRKTYLGLFPTPESAKAARDQKAKELHGQFARS